MRAQAEKQDAAPLTSCIKPRLNMNMPCFMATIIAGIQENITYRQIHTDFTVGEGDIIESAEESSVEPGGTGTITRKHK